MFIHVDSASVISAYGLVYALGFMLFVVIPFPRSKSIIKNPGFDCSIQASILTHVLRRFNTGIYAAIGAIVGGRLAYVFIYDWAYFSDHLTEIWQIYKGGMSYHGGVVGLIAALYLVDRQRFWLNCDRAALCAMLIIPLGRITNFFNGELYGIPTTMPWGVIFSTADLYARHPVQLYEAIGEGPLTAFLMFLSVKAKPIFGLIRGVLAGIYLCYYSIFRYFCELFREPDPQLGYILNSTITMGQLLCLATLCLGLCIIFYRQNVYLSR